MTHGCQDGGGFSGRHHFVRHQSKNRVTQPRPDLSPPSPMAASGRRGNLKAERELQARRAAVTALQDAPCLEWVPRAGAGRWAESRAVEVEVVLRQQKDVIRQTLTHRGKLPKLSRISFFMPP